MIKLNSRKRTCPKKLIAALVRRYHEKRLEAVKGITLGALLRRMNPYVLLSNGVSTARELVEGFLDSHLMLSDASRWARSFLEPLFEAVSGAIPAGRRGVDYVRDAGPVYTVYSLKSGPMVLNADQRQKQGEFFRESRQSWMSTGNQNGREHRHVLGCAYGSINSGPTRGRDFYTRSGQAFWEEATGDRAFFLKLADMIGHAHYPHKAAFDEARALAVSKLVRGLIKEGYCSEDGRLIWPKIIERNSRDRRTPTPGTSIEAGPAHPEPNPDSVKPDTREKFLERKRKNNRAYRARRKQRELHAAQGAA